MDEVIHGLAGHLALAARGGDAFSRQPGGLARSKEDCDARNVVGLS